jgi:hypothetical protein
MKRVKHNTARSGKTKTVDEQKKSVKKPESSNSNEPTKDSEGTK